MLKLDTLLSELEQFVKIISERGNPYYFFLANQQIQASKSIH